MKVTGRNITSHEIIGLKTRILQYPDRGLIGLEGRVVDETLKTLLVELSNGRRIRVFKSNGVFEFTLPSGETVVIKGSDIIGRPWDRLKNISR
ncbi:ribonuclease P protein component 1 [Desulfurococcus mucosus]|uniref:Ribonuclease P protein component 1 n=1 Tax=Desulfurococcus mucosus (strain ATCC 35584 / DSM 2162 / JCM 9187 / O7/1) TaxID=765177 RepID=E8RAN2_DESM0|nr:ribonuclease P protein subunit [Desulfurococcus mucosus]ADV65468.1 ribonuclease P protein subunit Rpp29 [Desulfurococcus mucosus DSM 2162]